MATMPETRAEAAEPTVLPPGSRVIIRETPEGLGIYVPAERNWTLISFMLLWLVGWAFGEVFAIAGIMSGDSLASSAFLLFWITLWTIGGLLAMWTLLWQLFGTDRLFVTAGAVVHAAGVGFLRRQSVHAIDEVKNPRIDTIGETRQRRSGRKTKTTVFRAILFEAGARTVRFGSGMDEETRRIALSVIRRHLARHAAGNADGRTEEG